MEPAEFSCLNLGPQEKMEYENIEQKWKGKLEDVVTEETFGASTKKHMDFYCEFYEDPTQKDPATGQPAILPKPNNYMKEYLQQITSIMKTNEKKFVDKEFAPEVKSLEGDGTNHYSKDWISGARPCDVWKRPDDFFGAKNYKLFHDDISPQDIKQGAIGNCYFMAAIAALADKGHSNRVARLFITRDIAPTSCYCFNVCEDGLWKSLLIDDLVPCYRHNAQPAFAKGNGNEIWVMLIEKVWAKMYGGYANIEGGWAREVLNELTGAPCTSFTPAYPNLFEEIMKATKFEWVMTAASSTGTGDHSKKSDNGISNNHLYSLLRGYEVQRSGKKVRLVQLRNPWGHTEWKGEWGDSWNGWTNELRTQLKFENKEDGIFFMPFEEFVKEFRKIEICMYFDNYKFTCLKTKSDYNKIKVFEVVLKTPGSYFFIAVQKNQRKFAKTSGYTYSYVNLKVASVDNGKIKYEDMYINPLKDNNIDTWVFCSNLEAKSYLVGVRSQWYNMKEQEFVFKVYGTDFVEIKNMDQKQYPFFLV